MKTSSTSKTDRYLKKYYLSKAINKLASDVGRSETFVNTRLRQLGLVRPPEVIERFKQLGRRKIGNVPPNKGKKQKEWMSRAGRKRIKATQFKLGHLPHNTRTDFEIAIRNDSSGHKYQYIRVALGKWVPLHRYNWEKAKGKIRGNLKLVFKDGNTMNCEVQNLELLTPAQLMERNSWYRYPTELGKIIQLQGALTRQINKHSKRLKNEK